MYFYRLSVNKSCPDSAGNSVRLNKPVYRDS